MSLSIELTVSLQAMIQKALSGKNWSSISIFLLRHYYPEGFFFFFLPQCCTHIAMRYSNLFFKAHFHKLHNCSWKLFCKMGNMGLCINYLTLECWLKKSINETISPSVFLSVQLIHISYFQNSWSSDIFFKNGQKLDFFCSPWKLQMAHEISSLHASVGESCGGIFFPPSAGRRGGGVIKKNAGNIISETELTLLQFQVSWEITVSWTAANDYWELIVCNV